MWFYVVFFELTTISRFQRLKPIQDFYHICYFLTFSVLSPLACFNANTNVSTHREHVKGISLRYGVIVSGDLTQVGAHRHVSCLVDTLLM